MPDNADIIRLTELLLSRQDQQQQQMDRLAAVAEAQTETNRRLDAGLAEAQATNQRLEASALRGEELHRSSAETHRRLDAGLAETKEMNRRLDASLAKTDEVLLTFSQIQSRMLDELEKLGIEQVRANRVQEEFARRQEEFAKRQDDFNIVFLEEIRGIKQDARTAKDITVTTVQEHEERLRRLEDFMNGFQSAA